VTKPASSGAGRVGWLGTCPTVLAFARTPRPERTEEGPLLAPNRRVRPAFVIYAGVGWSGAVSEPWRAAQCMKPAVGTSGSSAGCFLCPDRGELRPVTSESSRRHLLDVRSRHVHAARVPTIPEALIRWRRSHAGTARRRNALPSVGAVPAAVVLGAGSIGAPAGGVRVGHFAAGSKAPAARAAGTTPGSRPSPRKWASRSPRTRASAAPSSAVA
jgi:hypothetical protein